MTNEEAKKMLGVFRDYLTAGNPIWHKDEVAEAFNLAISALERDRWISVDVMVPDEYELVLVCFPIDEETTQYGFDVWLGCRWQDYKAQWWMQLPEPPKEET